MRVPSLTIGNHIFAVFSVPADGTGCQTSREAEISVRLRFMDSYRGQASSSLPIRINMARRTPKDNGGLSLYPSKQK